MIPSGGSYRSIKVTPVLISLASLFFLLFIFPWLFSPSSYKAEKLAFALQDDDVVNPFNHNHNHQPMSQEDHSPASIPNINSKFWGSIDTVYVIPGGGSGIPLYNAKNVTKNNKSVFDSPGYPEWTRKRTSQAYEHYSQQTIDQQKRSIFLALSTGSLNAPNLLLDDRRVMFECQHIIQHLIALGICAEQVYGDFISWDTVTNGFSLRLFVEAMFVFPRVNPKKPLQLLVYISDFHLDRMRAALSWALGLEPSLLPYIKLQMIAVDSLGFGDRLKDRLAHERKGAAALEAVKPMVRTSREMQAYLMLGGHKGLRTYVLGQYEKSSGGGW